MDEKELKGYVTALTEQMKSLESEDIEERHWLADELLCKLIRKLGYNELIDIYDSFKKWYA